ncbi:MAG TPA: transposase [Opitutaceae bacterium]|nr:transposase [Opitutaceae bacterium]
MRLTETIRLSRRRLPHWEVDGARYFITVRCADSLPADVVARLADVKQAMSRIPPGSVAFADARREFFRSLDRHLDAGHGACPLRYPDAAAIVVDELHQLTEWEIQAPHYSVMPNHWHAILVPSDAKAHSLSSLMKRLKGRTARRIRQVVSGSGPFWQGEWFDRWIRDDAEWDRIVAYIRNNPVKAGLVQTWELHPFTK